MYIKAKKEERDKQDVKPWQRRWMGQGTVIGDWLQREILLSERHYKKFTGVEPQFKMARTDEGYPFFEDFAKDMKVIEHKGTKFSLFGTMDGLLLYTTETGEVLRVGLEIKSKQTTYAQTSDYSLRQPNDDHVKQVTCYAMMYDLDYYLVAYVNTSKKSWNMTDEDFIKSPDIKVFGLEITEEMKEGVLDTFAGVVNSVNTNTPPKLDLERWTFNNFKTSCAKSLTDDEFTEIKEQTRAMLKSGLPEWRKQQYYNAFEFIKEVRERGAA